MTPLLHSHLCLHSWSCRGLWLLWVTLRPRASSQLFGREFLHLLAHQRSEEEAVFTVEEMASFQLIGSALFTQSKFLVRQVDGLLGTEDYLVSRKPQRKCRDENTETILKMECSPHRVTSCRISLITWLLSIPDKRASETTFWISREHTSVFTLSFMFLDFS